MLTEQEASLTDEIAARIKLKLLARQVLNDAHFQKILSDADPSLRRQCYEEIKPHLRFKPKPFCLMKFRKPKPCLTN